MLTNLFFPHVAGVRVERIWREGSALHLAVAAPRRWARCPLCQRRSTRRHSHYERTLADLSCAGARVVVHLQVRRFVCRVRWCRRKIFAERLPALVAPFARRTTRLAAHRLRPAVDLGGAPGARHLAAEGIAVSARTLLRLLRAAPLPAEGPVRVLGVDDWSRRKGRDFGTILVNLETHTVIDLLPDRSADTLARWLSRHPEGEVATRDRAGAYAEGIWRAAPQAVQVADRFHLRKNASEELERYLTCQHAALRRAMAGMAEMAEGAPSDEGAPAPASDEAVPAATEHPERRARRLARYEEVIALRAAGASCRTIAARVGLGQRTVKRWLQAGHFPERQRRREHPGQAAPFAPDLRERWAQGCHNATQLYRALRERGYRGCYGSVAALVAPWRSASYRHRGRLKSRRPGRPSDQPAYTPRQVCWLLWRPVESLSAEKQAYLARLYRVCPRVCPKVAVAEALVEEFAAVLRERDGAGLYRWLQGAEASGITEMQALARTMWLDREAVEAAVRTEFSNGQVEGGVNKLKLRKREMYGRGKLDLLRRRLLDVA